MFRFPLYKSLKPGERAYVWGSYWQGLRVKARLLFVFWASIHKRSLRISLTVHTGIQEHLCFFLSFLFLSKYMKSLWGKAFLLSCHDVFLSICQMSTVRPLRNPIIIIHGFGAFFFSFSFFFFFNNSNHSPGRRQGKMRWESVQQAAAFAQCHVNTPSPGWERKKNPCDIPPESPLTPKQSVELWKAARGRRVRWYGETTLCFPRPAE